MTRMIILFKNKQERRKKKRIDFEKERKSTELSNMINGGSSGERIKNERNLEERNK